MKKTFLVVVDRKTLKRSKEKKLKEKSLPKSLCVLLVLLFLVVVLLYIYLVKFLGDPEDTTLPTLSPTEGTDEDTMSPTLLPTIPTLVPSHVPSSFGPTSAPSPMPTVMDTFFPTRNPTRSPTRTPTESPSFMETPQPTILPTHSPTLRPSSSPSFDNNTSLPTGAPNESPSSQQTTISPTGSPTVKPTESPTLIETKFPTSLPTSSPLYENADNLPELVDVFIDTAFSIALHFSENVQPVEGVHFTCSIFFDYIFSEEAVCYFFSNSKFPQSFVFFQHTDAGLVKLAATNLAQFKVTDNINSVFNTNLFTANQVSVTLPPRPVQASLVENTLVLGFDKPVTTENISTTYCTDILEIYPSETDYSNGTNNVIETALYRCSVLSISAVSIGVNFEYLIPFFGTGSIIGLKLLSSIPILATSGIGQAFGYIESNPDFLQSLDFSFSASPSGILSKCQDRLVVELRESSTSSYEVTMKPKLLIQEELIDLKQQSSIVPWLLDLKELTGVSSTFERNVLDSSSFEFEIFVDIVYPYTNEVLDSLILRLGYTPVSNVAPFDIEQSPQGPVSYLDSVTFSLSIIDSVWNCLLQGIEESREQLVQYSWNLSEERRQLVTSSQFVLSPEVLGAGNYSVSIYIAFPNNVTYTKNRSFTLIEPPPVLSFAASTVSIGNIGPSYISAQGSCNPVVLGRGLCDAKFGYLGTLNESLGPVDLGFDNSFSFIWECVNCNLIIDPEENPLRPEISNAVVDEIYRLKLSLVRDDSQQVLISEDITVNAIETAGCDFLQPSINTIPEVSNPVDLIISSSFAGVDLSNLALNIKWTANQLSVEDELLAEAILADSEVVTNRGSLYVPSRFLFGGTKYVFRLTLSYPCEGSLFETYVEVATTINSAPVGGITSVAILEGSGFLPTASFSTTNWVDPERNLDLTYAFEYAIVEDSVADEFFSGLGNVFDHPQVAPVSSFSLSSTLETTFPITNPGFSLIIFARARDSLGAVSARISGSAFRLDTSLVSNPFSSIEGTDAIIDILRQEINIHFASGFPEKVSYLSDVVASFLNDQEVSQTEIQPLARDVCLTALEEAFSATVELEKTSFNTLTSFSSAVSALTNLVYSTSSEYTNAFLNTLPQITSEALNLIESGRIGNRVVSAPELSDNFLREFLVQSFSNSVSLLDSVNRNENESYTARKLQQAPDVCGAVISSKSLVADVALLSNSVSVPGGPNYNIQSSNVMFSTGIETAGVLGSPTGLQRMQPPNTATAAFFESGIGEVVSDQLQDSGQDISIYTVQWAKNVRCDRVLENIPDETCIANFSYGGPVDGSITAIAATFQVEIHPLIRNSPSLSISSDQPIIRLVLQEQVDLQANYSMEFCKGNSGKDSCGILQENKNACGAYDEILGDWSQEGCEVVESPQVGEGFLFCRCSHLSSFSTWKAWRDDTGEIFEGIECESAVANSISTLIVTAFFLISVLMFFWAKTLDSGHSKTCLEVSTACLTLRRFILKRKQRLAIRMFKERANNYMNLNTSLDRNRDIDTVPEEAFNEGGPRKQEELEVPDKREKIRLTVLLRNFKNALLYEHSLLSLSKYDPNYTRTQRMSVFLAVVWTELAVTTLFFVLLSADRLKIYEIIVVSILCTLTCAVPIKIVVKLLFRLTENYVASYNDMNANVSRILNRLENGDGRMLPCDSNLSDLYSQYVITSNRLSNTDNLGDEVYDLALPQTPDSQRNPYDIEGRIEHEIVHPDKDLDSLKVEIVEATLVARDAWKRDVYDTRTENGASFVENASVQVAEEAENESIGSTNRSHIPVAFYTNEAYRVYAVEAQPTMLTKLAALLADEASLKARPRTSALPAWTVFVNWIGLGVIIALVSALIIDWIRRRFQDIAKENEFTFLEVAEIRSLEIEEINTCFVTAMLGLIITYVVAEPLMLWVRFFLAPYLISKYGNIKAHVLGSHVDNEDAPTVRRRSLLEDVVERRTGSMHTTGRTAIEITADLFENVF
eukprot:augustus_masked-scaffold_16-processed-gene-5.6-mRNA-1 protein AED:0.46 eAED:0.46 QI:0/-1/0/1/-1/1/1/0/1985